MNEHALLRRQMTTGGALLQRMFGPLPDSVQMHIRQGVAIVLRSFR